MIYQQAKYEHEFLRSEMLQSHQVDTKKIIEYATQIASILEKYGISKKPFSENSIKFFENSDLEHKKRAFQSIKNCFELYSEADRLEILEEDSELLDLFFDQTGRKAPKDWKTFITPGEVIEGYECTNFIQIFRNLTFFEYCSYTIFEVFCTPFYVLYERSSEANELLVAEVMKTVGSSNWRTQYFDVPIFRMKEIFTDEQSEFDIHYGWISTLVKNGKRDAFLTSQTPRLISQVKQQAPLKKDYSHLRLMP